MPSQKQPTEIKTTKGTILPLRDMRGNPYLEVKYRLVWFREEHPDWPIETEMTYFGDERAVGKATIKNEQGTILATSHKQEDKKGFADYIEKAETGAIGRALALIGYGTQFAPDIDEHDRIVDSPATIPTRQAPVAAINRAPQPPVAADEEPPGMEEPMPGVGETKEMDLYVKSGERKLSAKGVEYWAIETDRGKMTSFMEFTQPGNYHVPVKASVFKDGITYTVLKITSLVRTNEQNALYWKWLSVLGEAAELSPENMHRLLKDEYFSEGEDAKTSYLTVEEFSQYLDYVAGMARENPELT